MNDDGPSSIVGDEFVYSSVAMSGFTTIPDSSSPRWSLSTSELLHSDPGSLVVLESALLEATAKHTQAITQLTSQISQLRSHQEKARLPATELATAINACGLQAVAAQVY
jgi:hypothetical protein